jgi:DNA polymerase elongation subunit (family B)
MSFYTNVATVKKSVYIRGVDDRGARFADKVAYEPTLYFHARQGQTPTHESMLGEPLFGKTFSNIYEASNYIREPYAQIWGKPYGLDNYNLTLINDLWQDDETIDFNINKIRIANIDIEVYAPNGFPFPEDANDPINAITVETKKKFFVFGCGDFETDRDDITYLKAKSEKHLLLMFLRFWERVGFDVLTGWHVLAFDVPYLINRITKVLGPAAARRMSPWKIIRERNEMLVNGFRCDTYELVGISILDYEEMYRKFRLKMRESYRLDFIAHIELETGKISYDEYGSLAELSIKNHQLFIEYNIRDVELISKLDDKLAFFDLVFSLAYLARVNYSDVFRQTRVWDGLMNHFLMKQNIVLPGYIHGEKTEKIAGAFVKAPQIGTHEWVVSYDAASLYPSTMIALNLGNETLDPKHQTNYGISDFLTGTAHAPEGFTVAANGHVFKKDERSFVATVVKQVLDMRKVAKSKMLEAERMIESIKEERARRNTL